MFKLTNIAKIKLRRLDVLVFKELGCTYISIAKEIDVNVKTLIGYCKNNPPTESEQIDISNCLADMVSENTILKSGAPLALHKDTPPLIEKRTNSTISTYQAPPKKTASIEKSDSDKDLSNDELDQLMDDFTNEIMDK
jgi:hypothetical protein